jgi:uncharacterized protein
MKSMEILIDDIPEEGLAVEASEADAWLAEVVSNALGESFEADGRARLALTLTRFEGNVNVDGELSLLSHPVCDRCGKPFEDRPAVHIHVVLAPLYENKRQQEREEGMEAELVREDLEFGYYEGDRFDLDEIVREQLVLAEPMKHLCREDCAGLCGRCGKDLNEGPCGCPKATEPGIFAALKDVRISPKRGR